MVPYRFNDADVAFAKAEALIRRAAKVAEREPVRGDEPISIDLDNFGLTELPESLRHLTGLRGLNLDDNRLDHLPDWLGELTNLRELSLRGNELTSLPASLGSLANLSKLWLQQNHLQAIPESLGALASLAELRLFGNKISALPRSIGQLTRLRILDLRFNRLTELPRSLLDLPALVVLELDHNELGLPPETLKNVAPTILAYYFRLASGKRPLNEAKLILVGRGGVGKTSIVNRLLQNRFDKDENKTDGINISHWNLRPGAADEVRLHLWDFGGQEIMHATHQFFLTQRSLYVLVLEGRQGAEDADAEYWLKLIESFGAEAAGEVSPVLVVLNKIGSVPFDLNRRALQEKYPFIRGFMPTDCSDSTGIAALRDAIEHETDRLKHVRASFPESWFAIKDRLAAMRQTLQRSFVSYDEYRALCTENGEGDHSAQDALASHLHSLGIALNFKDDARLRDTHILDPHWVTSGIYRILNSPLLAERKGELRLTDATQLLGPSEYPRSMHRFLFDLMKKFQLCFAFPDDESHYLIPELLDKQEAVEASEIPPLECLNFEYRYSVLPEGMLSRFIVRTHTLNVGLPRWRTGVVLAFEGNRALVKADVQDRRVFIRVSGPRAGRRRLLAVIRSDFDRIHSEIKLRPEAFVSMPDRPDVSIRYQRLLTFENKGVETFPQDIGDDVMHVHVQDLLDGVDLEGTRQTVLRVQRSAAVFVSYSHKDERFKDELETHLKLLQRIGLIAEWHDRKIEAGDDWKARIDEHLERADIVLLLVSADFIASDYCYEKEMMRALERHAAGEARVIPVVVRDVNWKLAPFAGLQALPKGGTAVNETPSRDAAWRGVSEGIERIAQHIRDGGSFSS